MESKVPAEHSQFLAALRRWRQQELEESEKLSLTEPDFHLRVWLSVTKWWWQWNAEHDRMNFREFPNCVIDKIEASSLTPSTKDIYNYCQRSELEASLSSHQRVWLERLSSRDECA